MDRRLTVDERRAAGRQARADVPLDSHAEWTPGPIGTVRWRSSSHRMSTGCRGCCPSGTPGWGVTVHLLPRGGGHHGRGPEQHSRQWSMGAGRW